MAIFAEVLQYAQGLRKFHAAFIGPVARGQCFKDIGDAHDPRLDRHLIALQPFRVALAIHPFVVATGIFRNAFEVFWPGQRLQHLDGGHDVIVNDITLRSRQCTSAYTQIFRLVS